MNKSGKILFVGGPKHGQLIAVEWHRQIVFPVAPSRPIDYFYDPKKPYEKMFTRTTYSLEHAVTRKGCCFALYLHEGTSKEQAYQFVCDPGPILGFDIDDLELRLRLAGCIVRAA